MLNIVKRLDRASGALRLELMRVGWASRGSISYEDAHHLCYEERMLFSKLVQENLEITKESHMPFF